MKILFFRAGKLGKAYGALTEWADAVDCMIGAMPPDSPCRKAKTNVAKAKCLAENFGSIDWPTASGCMMDENMKDMVIGKAAGNYSGLRDKNPYWRRPVGPGAGGWATRGLGEPGEMTPI